jgi:cytochrome oxidase assembly protein ShyY1
MTRRLPVIPTILVAAAAAVMIALGVWQLNRGREKDALIARYSASRSMPPIIFPTVPVADDQLPLFRHSTAMCLRPVAKRVTAGRNRTGEPGFAVIADCVTGAEGPGMAVELGWSKNPNAPVNWRGGLVSGIIAPDGRSRMRLVAATAPPGLEPSAPPSIETIPNNHRSYAAQWFLFAALAVGIFLLANRQRLAATPEP